MPRRVRVWIVALVVGVTSLIGASTATAAVFYASEVFFAWDALGCASTQSGIDTSAIQGAHAITRSYQPNCTSAMTRAGGAIGARAYLHKSGSLCRDSGWSYNASANWTTSLWAVPDCGSGTYTPSSQGRWKTAFGDYVTSSIFLGPVKSW